jgi:sugar/nucleoside kinase (ribokinase family)
MTRERKLGSAILGSIGDLLLDVVIVPRGGLRPGDDVPAEVRVGGGGQAANFCAWVAALDAAARLITRVGSDHTGPRLLEELRESGVDVRAVVGPEPTGAIAVLVDSAGDRSFATQRGAILNLRPEDIAPEWLDDLSLLHVPAYSLFHEPLASATIQAVGVVRSRGGLVAIDLSSAVGLVESGVERMLQLIRRCEPAIVFASEREAEVVGTGLDRLGRIVVRKRGARGCVVQDQEIAAPSVDVVDTTGAGDAFAAGFCVSYLRDADPIGAARAAVEVAARAVSKLGGRP